MKYEHDHERLLAELLEPLGGEVLKVRVLARNGFPDRLVIIKGRRRALYYHVELKRSASHSLSRLQQLWFEKLTNLGADCRKLHDESSVHNFVKEVKRKL